MLPEHQNLDLSELECPVCLQAMMENIYLCITGHSICQNCFMNVDNCPICRNPLTKTRNYKLEALVKQCKTVTSVIKQIKMVKCSFENCEKLVSLEDKKKHEANCKHRTIACVYSIDGCKFEGSPKHIIEHESLCAMRLMPCRYKFNGCDKILSGITLAEHELNCEKRSILTTVNEKLFKCDKCKQFLFTDIYINPTENKTICMQCNYARSRDLHKDDRLKEVISYMDSLLNTPCSFRKNGCPLVLRLSQKNVHNNNCAFRDVICDINRCPWMGSLKEFLNHVKTGHPPKDYLIFTKLSFKAFGKKFSISKHPLYNTKKYIFYYEEKIFYLIQFIKSKKIRFVFVLVGNEAEAKNYKFVLYIRNEEKRLEAKGECISDTNLRFNTKISIINYNIEELPALKQNEGEYSVSIIVHKRKNRP